VVDVVIMVCDVASVVVLLTILGDTVESDDEDKDEVEVSDVAILVMVVLLLLSIEVVDTGEVVPAAVSVGETVIVELILLETGSALLL